MKLLLFDDEEYVIESIKKNVNWEKTEIREVFTASSMKQAQTIMSMITINIIVSDIVVPQGSGFDFMAWVREKEYDVQVIFLTSYADFDYAKKAIALSSVDYLLKPIQFEELTGAIERAVLKVRESKAYKLNSEQNKTLLLENYWMDLLNGTIANESFLLEAGRLRLEHILEEEFLLVYLHLYEIQKKEEWDGKILNFLIKNVLDEMLSGHNAHVEAVVHIEKLEKYSHVAICEKNAAEKGDSLNGKEAGIFEELVRWLHEKLSIDVWCGVSDWVKPDGLAKALRTVKGMRDESLSLWNKVLYLSDFKRPDIVYENRYLSVWKTLLEKEEEQDLIRSMEEYLNKLEAQQMITRDILKRFRMDVMQMVYTWLAEKEIKAHLLFSTKENEQYYQNALNDLNGAKEFAAYQISRAIEYQKYINQGEAATGYSAAEQSVTEKLKQYIDRNYRKEIRRDELAELVYLNTDYMARIFKRETGISISTYLLEKRVAEAKLLLSQSNLPINTVSINVGYSNFSYFTKMFRENTGYSPLEYRRKYR